MHFVLRVNATNKKQIRYKILTKLGVPTVEAVCTRFNLVYLPTRTQLVAVQIRTEPQIVEETVVKRIMIVCDCGIA